MQPVELQHQLALDEDLEDGDEASELRRHHEAERRANAAQPTAPQGALQQRQHAPSHHLLARGVGPPAERLRVHCAARRGEVEQLANEPAKKGVLESRRRRKVGSLGGQCERRLP
jgi:hypothetical protein